jgi:flagellar biosynthesis/type III secretory pathway chaperone
VLRISDFGFGTTVIRHLSFVIKSRREIAVVISPSPLPPAAPLDLETEIGALLDDLSSVQTELLEVLDQKRQALATANVPRLAELQPREERLAARLGECHDRRTALLAAARKEGLPAENVAKLASRTGGGKTGKLGNRVKETASRMRLLQHQSLANWVLAQRSLLHVSQLLEIIATGGRMQPTYGDNDSVHSRGTLVNHEA